MDAPVEKLGVTQPINFRPGPLAAKIAELQAEVARRGGRITPTEIVREGLLGCWTEVRTHLLVRHTVPPAQSEEMSRFVAICGRALEHGVTPDELEAQVTALMERKLASA
ncbi:MAG TPA: hypothetical protein VG734_19445 [Lacunisphaera sp.]|nr:hypothetical protein [Lacunisphaera sp.]